MAKGGIQMHNEIRINGFHIVFRDDEDGPHY